MAPRPGPSYKPIGKDWIPSMYVANDASCTSAGTISCPTMKFCTIPACSTSHTSSVNEDWASVPLWSRRQTSKLCSGKLDPPNLCQDKGWWAAFAGVETNLRPTIYHLGSPDLSWHGHISDQGPAASGGQTVLANDRNSGRLRLIATRHDWLIDWSSNGVYSNMTYIPDSSAWLHLGHVADSGWSLLQLIRLQYQV